MNYIPRRAVIETTLACNLRCKHCGSRAGKPRDDEMTTAELHDLFIQLKDLGCERITLSGGEPTARPDWAELIGLAVDSGLRVGMFTNALIFDDEAAELAKSKGLESIAFSVDGLEKTHDRIRGKNGHFQTLMEAMESAKRASLPFSVVSHINRSNSNQFGPMHDMIVDKGAFAWQIQLGTDMGNMLDNNDLLMKPMEMPRIEKMLAGLQRRKKIRIHVSDSIGYFGPNEKTIRTLKGKLPRTWGGCGAGTRLIGVECNGNIKGCLSIMAGYNEQGADFVEGNIRKESLKEIWNKSDAFAYNRNWTLEDLGGFCAQCEHATKCRGGCRAKMTASGGGKENPMCVHKILTEEQQRMRRTGQAAAVLLAGALGAASGGCDQVEEPDPGPEDTTTNTDTANDTGTTIEDTDVMEYGDPEPAYMDPATDSQTESTDVTDYGEPEYGVPDPDTNVEDYGAPEPDYGEPEPEYGEPEPDTETEDVADYGDPGQ